MERQPQRPGGAVVGVGGGGGDGQAGAGQGVADGGLAGWGGQPHQQWGGDAGGVGQLEVAGEFAGQALGGFGGPVVLQEEVDLLVVFAPPAVAVGMDEPPPAEAAGLLGPPQLQLGTGVVAGVLREGAEDGMTVRRSGFSADGLSEGRIMARSFGLVIQS